MLPLTLLSMLTGIALDLGVTLGLCTMPTAVDSYLFARYVETPKVDSAGNFEGKDAKAAALSGRTLEQEVIQGMTWDLRVRLYNLMRAGDAEGIYIGITSGYRGNARQAMTSGKTKNAPGHSFHGGSLVGGWGHGKAADLVALAPTRELQKKENLRVWAFIDRVGSRFGLGRPFGDRDAPHVAPLTSREFAVAMARAKTREARVRLAKHKALAHKKKPHIRVASR